MLPQNPIGSGPESGLSTRGGVLAGNRFFRSPGDMMHALRAGLINLSDLGQVQFGVRPAAGTYTPENTLWYNSSGLPGPSGYRTGNAWFGSEDEYKQFMGEWGNRGPRVKNWLSQLFGQPVGGAPAGGAPQAAAPASPPDKWDSPKAQGYGYATPNFEFANWYPPGTTQFGAPGYAGRPKKSAGDWWG